MRITCCLASFSDFPSNIRPARIASRSWVRVWGGGRGGGGGVSRSCSCAGKEHGEKHAAKTSIAATRMNVPDGRFASRGIDPPPMLGQLPAGNRQCQIAPEEDAGHSSGLLRIQMEIAADVRQDEGS